MKYLGKIQHEKDLITKEYSDKYTKAILDSSSIGGEIETAPHTETEITISNNLRYFKAHDDFELNEDNTTNRFEPYKMTLSTLTSIGTTIDQASNMGLVECPENEARVIFDIDNKRWLPKNCKKSYLYKVSKTITTYQGATAIINFDFVNNVYTCDVEEIDRLVSKLYLYSTEFASSEINPLPILEPGEGIKLCEYIGYIDSYDLKEFTEIDDTGYFFVIQPLKKTAFIVRTVADPSRMNISKLYRTVESATDKIQYINSTDNTLKTLATIDDIIQKGVVKYGAEREVEVNPGELYVTTDDGNHNIIANINGGHYKLSPAIVSEDRVTVKDTEHLYRKIGSGGVTIQTAPHTETEITLSSNLKYYKNKEGTSYFNEDNTILTVITGSDKTSISTINGKLAIENLRDAFIETTQSEANIIYDAEKQRMFPINCKKSYLFKINNVDDLTPAIGTQHFLIDFENNTYIPGDAERAIFYVNPSYNEQDKNIGINRYNNLYLIYYIRAIDSYDLTEFTEIDGSGYYFIIQPFKKTAFIVKRTGDVGSKDELQYLDTSTDTFKTLATTNFVESYVEQYLQNNLKTLIESMSLNIDGGSF